MNNAKRTPWHIAAAILSVLFITGMWMKKDIAAVYASMPPDQLLPPLVTTAAVTFLKVSAGAAVILCLRKMALKIREKHDRHAG